MNPYPALNKTIEYFRNHIAFIPQERKSVLEKLAIGVKSLLLDSEQADLIFICTHNSRRSHFGQVWAHFAAACNGLADKINTFSGGTEATAFHPNAIASLAGAGFQIETEEGKNPISLLKFSDIAPPITCFSKVYDDPSNPQSDFIAVMTCSDADENCPYIPGATQRFTVTYEDPKISDGTPLEPTIYDERSLQIGTEMWYVMDVLNSLQNP
jgi:arsenate reductase